MIIESILECRRKDLDIILKVPYDLAAMLEDKYLTSAKRNQIPRAAANCCHGDKNCVILSYGSLILNLIHSELWPIKSTESITVSVNTFVLQLKTISIAHLPDVIQACQMPKSHRECLPVNITQKIDKVLANKPRPVLISHSLHMTTQHERLNPRG